MMVAMGVIVSMVMVMAVAFRGRLGGRVIVVLIMVVVVVVMIVVVMAVMIVVLAHASFPLAGSAICSSISFRTSLICASAAE